MDQREYEDMVIARAADLYREWYARPWYRRLMGRMRAAWRRFRIARKGW